jgi:hypothetical protein
MRRQKEVGVWVVQVLGLRVQGFRADVPFVAAVHEIAWAGDGDCF